MKKAVIPIILFISGLALFLYGNKKYQNESQQNQSQQQGKQSSTVATLRLLGGLLMVAGLSVAFAKLTSK